MNGRTSKLINRFAAKRGPNAKERNRIKKEMKAWWKGLSWDLRHEARQTLLAEVKEA